MKLQSIQVSFAENDEGEPSELELKMTLHDDGCYDWIIIENGFAIDFGVCDYTQAVEMIETALKAGKIQP